MSRACHREQRAKQPGNNLVVRAGEARTLDILPFTRSTVKITLVLHRIVCHMITKQRNTMPLCSRSKNSARRTESAPSYTYRPRNLASNSSQYRLFLRRACLRFPGCFHFGMKVCGRSRNCQRPASSVLTVYLSPGDHRIASSLNCCGVPVLLSTDLI